MSSLYDVLIFWSVPSLYGPSDRLATADSLSRKRCAVRKDPARQSAHQTVMAVTEDLVDPRVAYLSRMQSPRDHRDRWIGLLLGACALFALPTVAAQSAAPQIVAVTPRSGAEGTRVEVRGKNLHDVSAVLFAATNAVFQIISPASLVAIVPHRVATSRITVITKQGQAQSPVTFIVENDPRIPDEVSDRRHPCAGK